MSTSMPVSSRNGASSSLTSATTSSCWRRRSAESPFATVSRGEWSVSTRYSWPRSRAVRAISRMGLPPSDQSEWLWQSPRSAARRASAGGSLLAIAGGGRALGEAHRQLAVPVSGVNLASEVLGDLEGALVGSVGPLVHEVVLRRRGAHRRLDREAARLEGELDVVGHHSRQRGDDDER